MLNNIRQDLKNYHNDWGAQGFWVMIIYRFGKWRYTIKLRILRKIFSFIYKITFKFVQIITGIELPCEAEVGDNFIIDHFGGVVISGYAKLGNNCRIRNGVVIGLKNVNNPVGPQIGNDVDIGAGAKVLGAIKVGNRVTIGANAVVIQDVPDDSIAVGVPAIIKKKQQDKN